jgi:hypothetical protein
VRLTLLVPELIWPEPADQFTLGKLAAPGFEWLIAHATCQQNPRQAFETTLAECFGLPNAPLAALRLLGEEQSFASDGNWLCADPVHLRFHQERVILADAGAFDLAEDEAHTLVAALNAEFADIGTFHAATTRRWYLRLNATTTKPTAGPRVHHDSEPISAVAGRRVDSDLPKGDSTLTRWLNEVQMFLHCHPINQSRQGEGKPAVNSMWLWGGGKLSTTLPSASFSGVWTDNPLAIGLAKHSQTPVHATVEHLAQLLPQAGGHPLVILDPLLSRVLYEDGDGWRKTFEQFEADWFTPLKNQLGSKLKQIDLIAPTIYGNLHYTLTAGERWKFWKRSENIVTIAEQLAENANP